MNTTNANQRRSQLSAFGIRTTFACLVLLCAANASADVGPPVSIKMPPDRAQAVNGQPYDGVFEVTLHKPGTLTDFRIVGEGWTILSFEPPATPLRAEAGVIRVPFRAVPTDADKAIGLALRFDGRKARHAYRLGPTAFAKKGRHGSLRIDTAIPSGSAATGQDTARVPDPFDLSGGGAPGTRGGTVVVEGRIVYDRPGVDRSDPPDGDFSDPEDTQPMQIGADGISYAILDNDPVDYEVMWEGVTDEFGRFVTPPLDANMDGDGSGPDLILSVAALRQDWGGVFDQDADWYYVWDSEEIEDFEGSYYNFGTRAPLDQADHPAIHIYNSIVRTRRFILENPNIATRFVTVLWPADHWSEYHEQDDEIHLLDSHGWREDVVIHEYGHHFLAGVYELPPPDYCNGFCDGMGNCDFDSNCPDAGHCPWCRETDHDAWGEGWPNWLADVATRHFTTRYRVDAGGSAYEVLYPLDAEWPNVCCVDMQPHDPVRAEGFVAALLRDIDDATLDDHDDDPDPNLTSFDGIRDLMCIGPNHIFQAVVNHHPITVLDFLNGLRADWPQFTPNLRATAFNVGGAAYVAGFPSDSQPPGPVLVCDSPSHPLGGGGALPCMTIAWTPAADDASGAVAYSYELTRDPAGLEPDETADPISSTESCQLAALRAAISVGDYYFSIKAQDAAGNWSGEWRTFGPFTVTDCNGTGLLDLCDIDCPSDGVPGVCPIGGLCVFGPGVDCGLSSDCNGNYVPDECDIAQGNSEDCNQNGIPDECETSTLKHWTGNDGTNPTWWHLGTNWAEGAAPATGNDVCIATGEPTPLLRRDTFTLGMMACYQDLNVIQGSGLPAARLNLTRSSFILGDLNMTSGRIDVADALTIAGALDWSGGTLSGAGQTTVTGSHHVNGQVALQFHTLNLHCDTFVSAGGFAGGGNTNFVIRNFPGRTYTQAEGIVHQANGSIFINEGTILKPSGSGVLRLDSPVDNFGQIRANEGTLRFGGGLTSNGEIVGAAGTLIELFGSQSLEVGSSLIGDQIAFRGSAAPDSRFVRGTYQANSITTIDSGASVLFAPGATITGYGSDVVIAGIADFQAVHGAPIHLNNVNVSGQARFNSGDPIVMQTLVLGPGNSTLRGASQQFTIDGLFTWKHSADILDPGEIFANGDIMIEPSSGQRDFARVLFNPGTATFLGAIASTGAGRFHNLPTGTALLQGDSTGVTGGRVTNEGTIVKTAGTGRSTLAQLTNSGLVHAQTGEMYFYFGSTNDGEIRGDPGTLLTFNVTNAAPPVNEMSAGSTLTADRVTFTGQGTCNIRGNVQITGRHIQDGPTCIFTNEANVTSYGPDLDIQAGTVRYEANAPGPNLNLNTATLRGNVHFTTGQPVNIDALTLVTGTINGPSPITLNGLFTFNSGTILAGGLMTANGPVSINSNGNTRNLQRNFDNAATLTFVNGGLQLSNATLTNLGTGSIDIQTTGTAFGLATNATLQNNGVLVKSAGAGASTIGNHFRNAGTVDVRTGVLSFTGTNGLTHIQTAGQTLLNGGNLAVTSPGIYQVQGGVLKGNGTITGSVTNSGGVTEPGLSAGMIAITGAYTQQSGGALAVEIGGTAAGQFDVLTVSGAATIAGELNVQTIDGFTPATGNTFVVLTAGSISGTFATLSGTPGFSASYTPTQVILTYAAPSLPGDLDGDCDVDIADLAVLLSNYGTTSGATPGMGDSDGDGDVDLADLATLLGAFGGSC